MKLVIAVLLLGLSQTGFACLCEEQTIEKALNDSSSVFTGRVISISRNYGPEFKLVELSVLRVFKGPKINRIEVKTPERQSDCGYPFTRNEEYVVYATGDKVLSVSKCSRTNSVSKASKEIQKLMAVTKSTLVGPTNAPRDPFASSPGDTIRTHRATPAPGTLTVSSAVITGIISSGSEFTALIRAADGKAFSMKVGDRLADGEILKIDSESVTFLQNGRRIRKTIRPFRE